MNSNFGKFDFDLGIGSNNRSSKPLNEQKNKSGTNSYSYSTITSKTTPSWPQGKPSWTHQSAPSQPGLTRTDLGGPASMVGDITGKSWNSTAPQTGAGAGIGVVGIVNKNPNLFGDLVNSSLGQNSNIKGSSNAPLKSVAPAKSSFSMGGMADSLPKTNTNGNVNNYNSAKAGAGVDGGGGGGGWGGNQTFPSGGTSSVGGYGSSSMNKGTTNLGGAPLRTGGSSGGIGGGMGSNKDPFGSLLGFSSKPMGSVGVGGGNGMGSSVKGSTPSSVDFDFGDFQNASKSNNVGSNVGSVPKMDSFVPQSQAPSAQSTGADSFDILFPTTAASTGGNSGLGGSVGGQQFSGGDDWGFDSDLGGHDDHKGTTELDGLPPPPAGVSASTAKSKGMDNYKQGQFADAIKWLSWAEILLEKAGESTGTMEVLSCRASCYKEVGEYKKAVADCTKILDNDGNNVAVLVQRALLYESMEKYRLGADDLRLVMKIDPGNRVARSTIHRLNKMAD